MEGRTLARVAQQRSGSGLPDDGTATARPLWPPGRRRGDGAATATATITAALHCFVAAVCGVGTAKTVSWSIDRRWHGDGHDDHATYQSQYHRHCIRIIAHNEDGSNDDGSNSDGHAERRGDGAALAATSDCSAATAEMAAMAPSSRYSVATASRYSTATF